MAMRLAEYVAHTTDVDGMLDGMTTAQFDEWWAKDQVEPIGRETTRSILALIGTLVASFGGAKCGIAEFMPWVEEKPMELTADQLPATVPKRGPDGA